ncbi:MAG: alpha/beta hydrolase family protein [Janthinobacterium lividum]
MKHLCLLFLAAATLPAAAQNAPTSFTGDWSGSLTGLTFTVHLQDPAGGPRTATLDIPAQNAKGLPLQFTAKADSVYLTLAMAKAKFAGRRTADGQALAGEWRQGGQAFPLTLKRLSAAAAAAAAAGPVRPQTPKAPFPYQTQEMTFASSSAGITLAGTFTVPAGKGPFPAVALLTGSGPEDRNEEIFGHQPFAVLADYLTRRGIAVLRFDDRGVGKSGGTQATMTSATYAADARLALAWLRARPEIKKNRVGLIGHSEGGTAAILAAGQAQGPDELVLLAAPGIAGNELIVSQVLALGRLRTTDPVALAQTEKVQRQVLDAVMQNPDNAQARAKLLPLLSSTGTATAAIDQTIAVLTSPSYRALLADQPAKTLPLVHCPVLALGGSKDRQVPAAASLAGIKQGLQAGGNKDVTTQELPGLNHLFQTATTGSPAEYGTIEETFAPAALQVVGDWLVAHGK